MLTVSKKNVFTTFQITSRSGCSYFSSHSIPTLLMHELVEKAVPPRWETIHFPLLVSPLKDSEIAKNKQSSITTYPAFYTTNHGTCTLYNCLCASTGPSRRCPISTRLTDRYLQARRTRFIRRCRMKMERG